MARTAQRLSLALVRYRLSDESHDRPSAAPARARCGGTAVAPPKLDDGDKLLRLRRRGGFRGRSRIEGKVAVGVDGAGTAEAVGADAAANERDEHINIGDCG